MEAPFLDNIEKAIAELDKEKASVMASIYLLKQNTELQRSCPIQKPI